MEHRPAFEAFLHRRLGDDTVAEDLLQQSLVKAVQHHHALQKQESVVPWFYGILRHALVDYYRSRAADARRQESFSRDASVLGEPHAPAPDEVAPTVCACLDQLLPTLRPEYAQLLRRVDLAEESLHGVAQDLKISESNARVRLHRARKALRASLESACGICSKHGCLNCTCR